MAGLLVFGPALLPGVPGSRRGAPRRGRARRCRSAGVLSVVYGFKRAAQDGADATAGAAVTIGLWLAVAWFRRQQRRADPWIDLGLFRRRAFSVPLAANALCFFVLYGTQFFIVQYLQLVLGLSPLHAGLWTIPSAVGYLVGSVLAPALANRVRPRWLLGGSLAVAALGFGLLTQVGPEAGLAVVVAGSVTFSVGLAPVYVLATEMTVASAPPARSGSVSGILETAANLGGALGIAFLGTLGGAVYRNAMPPGSAQTLGEATRSGLADVARRGSPPAFIAPSWWARRCSSSWPSRAGCSCATAPTPARRPPRSRAGPTPRGVGGSGRRLSA